MVDQWSADVLFVAIISKPDSIDLFTIQINSPCNHFISPEQYKTKDTNNDDYSELEPAAK